MPRASRLAGSGTTDGVLFGSTGFRPCSSYCCLVSSTTAPLTGVTVTASLGVQLGLDDARHAPDFGGWAAVGLAAAATRVTASNPKPAKTAGEKIADEGDGGSKIAEYLVGQKLI